MNRIAGILNLDNSPVAPERLLKMANVMKLQAEDPSQYWADGVMGLACVSLGNHQLNRPISSPCLHPNRKWSIVFDGRIDNRHELLTALGTQPPSPGTSISDEGMILMAYEKWGLDFPEHLLGDFAVALWDALEQRLVCVRDHFGVKPFYFSHDHHTFVVASTPDAILASGRVAPIIYEERIADLLMEFSVKGLEGVDKSCTFYKNIFRLPPAQMAVVQMGEVKFIKYWSLEPATITHQNTELDYIEAFKHLFEISVRSRLLDHGEAATMLSGGLDSSSVTGMGRKIFTEDHIKPLDVIAVISDTIQTNRESPYIRSVLSQGNLQPHLLAEGYLHRSLAELVKAIEGEREPFDALMNLNRMVYLRARTCGFGAVLDGIDGDLLLADSGHLLQLWRAGKLHAVLKETFQAQGLLAEYKLGRKAFFDSLLSLVVLYIPNGPRSIRRKYRYSQVTAQALKGSIINQEFAVRSRLGERFARLEEHRAVPPSIDQIQFHKIDWDHPFLTAGLERYERVASAFGVEASHPFTDVRLAKFCLGLPWQLKSYQGWTKMIMRRAMEPYLPVDVVWRSDKDSLMWEMNRIVLKEKADYFHQATLDEKENLKPYVDVQKLENFWQEYLVQGEEKNAVLIWSGISLAFWLRRHKNMVRDLKL